MILLIAAICLWSALLAGIAIDNLRAMREHRQNVEANREYIKSYFEVN